MIVMARFGSPKNEIGFLCGNLVPIIWGQAFFAHRTSMMILEPDLEARKTKEMATFCQCAHVETTLADNA
jgi:hypothetical protein